MIVFITNPFTSNPFTENPFENPYEDEEDYIIDTLDEKVTDTTDEGIW